MAEDGRWPQLTESLSDSLLQWYDAHGRDLPWRMKAARPDPYRVWLSEIMLQQTTAAAVRGYFETFTKLWPTVHALAAADLDAVLKAWAGLGYYARARNLHACAREVSARYGGVFPSDPDELQKLPGIGPYTAGAIAAIAFDQPHAAVDGNVERVLSRLAAIETPLPKAKPQIRALAAALVPRRRAGDFAQALMDLGATLCTPKSPNCAPCPWESFCRARQLGLAASLPRRLAKRPLPTRKGYAYLALREDGALLLQRRPDKGLLGGMMEVPGSPWAATLPRRSSTHAPVPASWRKLPGHVGHTFTHFHLELTVMFARVKTGPIPPNGRWVPLGAIGDEALPSVMKKVLDRLPVDVVHRRDKQVRS